MNVHDERVKARRLAAGERFKIYNDGKINPYHWDWDALQLEFLKAGQMNLKTFTYKHGLHYGQVRNHAAEGRWLQNRKAIHAGACTDEGVALCDVCRKAIKRL